MAVKDVYLPYEEWITQIAAVEDTVMGGIFFRMFGDPKMREANKDKYFLQYPHKQSYLSHCVELQDRSEVKKAFRQYMINQYYLDIADENQIMRVETTDYDASVDDCAEN